MVILMLVVRWGEGRILMLVNLIFAFLAWSGAVRPWTMMLILRFSGGCVCGLWGEGWRRILMLVILIFEFLAFG